MRTHCQRCEDKDAELAYLRSELAMVDEMETGRQLRLAVGLGTHTETRILLHFMRCRHHMATRLQLADLLRNDDTNSTTVDAFMSRIRRHLGQDMFETFRGQGWRLTEAGLARLEAILARVNEPGPQNRYEDGENYGRYGDHGPGRGLQRQSA